jgi:hypothetical protein
MVEAGEHSGFHFFDVVVVYWGFGIMGVSCAVGYEETVGKEMLISRIVIAVPNTTVVLLD